MQSAGTRPEISDELPNQKRIVLFLLPVVWWLTSLPALAAALLLWQDASSVLGWSLAGGVGALHLALLGWWADRWWRRRKEEARQRQLREDHQIDVRLRDLRPEATES